MKVFFVYQLVTTLGILGISNNLFIVNDTVLHLCGCVAFELFLKFDSFDIFFKRNKYLNEISQEYNCLSNILHENAPFQIIHNLKNK